MPISAPPKVEKVEFHTLCLNCLDVIENDKRYCESCQPKVDAGWPRDSFGRFWPRNKYGNFYSPDNNGTIIDGVTLKEIKWWKDIQWKNITTVRRDISAEK
jgi:hypothetical protein